MNNNTTLTQVPAQDIIIESFRFTPTGLEAVGTPSYESWLACGKFIRQTMKNIHFALGDWLVYGEMKWGETYREAVALTGFDIQTLRNDKWVASRIPAERRQEQLSFDHHQQVADLDEEEQVELLTRAVAEKIPSTQFRKLINKQDLNQEKPQVVITPFQKALSAGQAFLESLEALAGTELSPDAYEDLSDLLEDIGRATTKITYESTNS